MRMKMKRRMRLPTEMAGKVMLDGSSLFLAERAREGGCTSHMTPSTTTSYLHTMSCLALFLETESLKLALPAIRICDSFAFTMIQWCVYNAQRPCHSYGDEANSFQILHVMTATLHHAHPVLAAASHAGFRESGLQSLRCLEVLHSNGPDQHSSSTDNASHSPIVAVRSAGLALESVIGYCEHNNDDSEPLMRSLVTEEYLQMLVALANERFKVNKERVERFRSRLLNLYEMVSNATSNIAHRKKPSDWEDSQTRKERKRLEGLRRQAEKFRQKESESNPENTDIDMSISFETIINAGVFYSGNASSLPTGFYYRQMLRVPVFR